MALHEETIALLDRRLETYSKNVSAPLYACDAAEILMDWRRLRAAAKPSESSMVQRIEAWEAFGRRVAGARIDVGHDGDEESGQHDPDCEGCLVDSLKAEADHLLHGPPDPERDRETKAETERP